jgi:hypothetical protein
MLEGKTSRICFAFSFPEARRADPGDRPKAWRSLSAGVLERGAHLLLTSIIIRFSRGA